jgi:hypothetical protein
VDNGSCIGPSASFWRTLSSARWMAASYSRNLYR